MKKITIISLAAAMSASLFAAPLTPEQALQRAGRDAAGPARKAASTLSLSTATLTYTHYMADRQPAAYVFEAPDGHGFTLLSADSRAIPVLGYSDNGTFDPENIPDGLRYMLDTYAEQLAQADKLNLPEYKSPARVKEYAAIPPLVKTQWDQLAPYNNDTPVVDKVQSPTGCVATSLAQVMNYFQYPAEGEGIIVYDWGLKKNTLVLRNKPFNWDQMLPTYKDVDYTDEQGAAVAFLMKAAGYSVQMDYSASQSGAFSERIIEAVTKYFRYDPGVWYACRSYYSQDEWYDMMITNLLECGPIIYNGSSPLAGGHSFICDGYDGEGLFHINWGWSGVSDGYFSLDILGPNAQGTGGSLGNFSYSQDAVLGMRPDTGATAAPHYGNLQQCGATVGELDGNILKLGTTDGSPRGWFNSTSTEIVSVLFGAQVRNNATGEEQVLPLEVYDIANQMIVMKDAVTIEPAMYLNSEKYTLDTTLPALADGEYTVTVMTQDQNAENAPWLPINIDYGYANYLILQVDGGKYKVLNLTPAELKVAGFEFATELTRSKNVKLAIKFENPSDVQVTACVTPRLIRKEQVMYQAASRLITVDPHSTLDYEWITKFYMLNGADSYFTNQEFTLELVNQANKLVMYVSEEVPMRPIPENLLVVMDELSVEGVTPGTVNVDGKDVRKVYSIPEWENFTVDFAYTIKRGYLDTTMTLAIYEKDADGKMIKLYDVYSNRPFFKQGDSDSVTIETQFPYAKINKLYYLRAEYMLDEVPLYLGQIPVMFLTENGVDTVEADQTAPEYYTLQGIRITEPVQGQIVIERRGGKTTKRIFK